ncbi:MAG: hypothetical protein L6R39_001250 [Caloplaca ligustica]|nr:MAG: hypothetical protein L6R39_001250 [Caloplaca ligustica]
MAATHTIARRKPATYGKASRKPLCHQFSSAVFDPVPSSVAKSSSQSRAASLKPHDSPGLVAPHHGTQIPKLKRSSAGLTQSPRTGCIVNDADVWDILSSDEEQASGYHELTRARKKQKRSLDRPATIVAKNGSRQMQLGSDDQLLSPTATSNVPCGSSGSLPLDLSSSRVLPHTLGPAPVYTASTERSRASETSQHLAARASGPHNGRMCNGSYVDKPPPSTPRRSGKAGVSDSPPKANKRSSPLARSVGPAVQTWVEPIHTNYPSSSIPRTPTSMRRSVEATTPHQRELWGLLLPQANEDISPTWAASPSPVRAHESSIYPVSEIVRPADVLKQSSRLDPMPNRRRRLIDRLRPATQKPQQSLTSPYGSALMFDSDGRESSTPPENLTSKISEPPHGPNTECPDSSDSRGPVPPMTVQHRRVPTTGLKTTYSSQRSHLANIGLADTRSFDMPLSCDGMSLDDSLPSKPSRKETQPLELATFEDPGESDFDGPRNTSMRTIHELRESGENVRQLNEMEALFDDIGGPGLISVGFRRGKLLELATKLQDSTCCRFVLDQGLDSRLLSFSALTSIDTVTETLLASMILHLVAAPSGARATSQVDDARIADLFSTRLEDDQDLTKVAQSRKSNISRRVQSDLTEYVDRFLHSNLWRVGTPVQLSSRIIGLQGLEYLARRRREAGCGIDILPPRIIGRLLQILPTTTQGSTLHSSANHSLETEIVVSILESCTISGTNHDDGQWTEITLAPVLAILPRLNHVSSMNSEGTQRLALRLYLNLTNNDPRLCHVFAKVDVIRSILDIVESHSQILSNHEQQPSSSAALDTLILAFATLINLVEWSPAVRHIMSSTEKKGDCFLDTLTRIFIARLQVVAQVSYNERHEIWTKLIFPGLLGRRNDF